MEIVIIFVVIFAAIGYFIDGGKGAVWGRSWVRLG
jgi:hypothetical protein